MVLTRQGMNSGLREDDGEAGAGGVFGSGYGSASRRSAGLLLAAILALVGAQACGGSSGSSQPQPTTRCVRASDCTGALACIQGFCVEQCVESKDCPSGERCIAATGGTTNTCQPPETAKCTYTSQCTNPLVCGIDEQCRSQCQSDVDCPHGQKCTSNSKLCADPTIDTNYDPATNEFVGALDGGAGGASGSTDGGHGGAGGADAEVDAPVTNPVDSGTGSGGSDGATESSKRDASIAGASGTTCAPGQTPTKFRFPATSDSNPNYTSGVGALTATELLAFNAYAGPDSADGGTGAMVNRIDVQHFDPSTGASKGPAAPLLTAAGDGSGIYVNGAAVAPTGEIAIIYSASTGGAWGAYLAFLDKNLAPVQTTLFVVAGSESYHNQSYVQWLNGQFVASDVFGNQTIKLGRFGVDGSNLGITRAVPTDDPSALVNQSDRSSGEVAFSGSTFAVAFSSYATGLPLLTFVDALDPLSVEVASPVALPSANQNYPVAVAGTSQGFVAVYNGTSSSKTNSLLATYVSNSASGDAGVPVGATYAFLGGFVYISAWSTRGSSDGTGAGFAALYPDGSVSFLYFSGDGSMHGNPQTVLQQTGTAGPGDEARITNFAGKFAVSLYSSGEHLTRVITSTCQ